MDHTNVNNITQITAAGICVGCGSCSSCEHITFINNQLGFPAPVVDEKCTNCGSCLSACPYHYDDETDD